MSNKTESPKDDSPYIATCNDMKVDLSNAGKFITLKAATESLQAYLQAPGTPPRKDPKHIYGHGFGLNNIRTLLYRIDQYNGNVKPADKKIAGIRIYYGLDERHDPSFPLRPPHGKFRDLIFVPLMEDGNDFYPIDHDLEDPVMILSEGRPCPTQCSFCFLDRL
jgi:hypothetical protein